MVLPDARAERISWRGNRHVVHQHGFGQTTPFSMQEFECIHARGSTSCRICARAKHPGRQRVYADGYSTSVFMMSRFRQTLLIQQGIADEGFRHGAQLFSGQGGVPRVRHEVPPPVVDVAEWPIDQTYRATV